MRVLYLSITSLVALQAAPLYQISSIGSFGGSESTAFAISSTGQAAGYGTTANGTSIAFSSNGNASILGAQSQAQDVNASGVVIGTTFTSAGARATVWQNGVANQILSVESYGLGLNDAGDTVGAMQAGNTMKGFLKSGSQITTITTPGEWSAAYDVNSSRKATGTYLASNGTFQAFTWTAAGGSVNLGTLGGQSSYAQALNNAGKVVGTAQTGSGALHAFMYDGSMRDLGTLGGSISGAYDINGSGAAVGSSLNNAGQSRAFVWMNGTMFDLNTLLKSNTGWTLEAAYGINDQGQIVGSGVYQGQSTAFRLDPLAAASGAAVAPVPEPGTLGLLGMGSILLLVGGRRHHRRRGESRS